jgi:hypothetical protein
MLVGLAVMVTAGCEWPPPPQATGRVAAAQASSAIHIRRGLGLSGGLSPERIEQVVPIFVARWLLRKFRRAGTIWTAW